MHIFDTNPQQSPASTLTMPDARFAGHVERNLTFCTRPAAILDGHGISQAALLDRFVRLSLNTASAPYISGSRNCFDPAAGKLADLFPRLMLCGGMFREAGFEVPLLQYAPHIQLLMQVFLTHRIQMYCGEQADPIDRGVARLRNDFVDRLRNAVRAEKSLRRRLHNWSFGSRENVAGLNAYLDDLFARYGSLAVLHLRLSCATAHVGLDVLSQHQRQRDFDRLRTCRTRFFDRMRRKPSLFTDAPRYVWSVMPLASGAHELHVTLIFSSMALQKVREDRMVEAGRRGVSLRDHADEVGEYWVATGTGGSGSYWRGDRNTRLYDRDVWVHGEIRADDILRRGKLRESLGYLARRRELVRWANEVPGEYFGMSRRSARRRPVDRSAVPDELQWVDTAPFESVSETPNPLILNGH